MKYHYLAKLKNGEIAKGVIEAKTKEAAGELITKDGVIPISIAPVADTQNIFKSLNDKTTFIPFKEKVLLMRQLSTLISAGIPISKALSILVEQIENKKLKNAIIEVAADIEGGTALSKAMEKQKDIFSPLVLNMVKAGEVGGILDESLDRVASEMEKEHKIASQIRSSMIYPVAILVITVCVLVFMIIYLIPQMTKIFESLGAGLPPNLKMLLAFSNFLTHFGIFVAFGIVGAVFGIRYFLANHYPSRLFWHKALLKLPVFGKIITKVNISHFTRSLSALLASGVSVIEAMEVSKDSLKNEVYKADIKTAIAKIENGSSIADALKESRNFPAVVCQTIAVGEETGSTDKILVKLTEFYENEVENLTKGLSDLILPVMMVLIGIVVGLIFYSIIVPLSQISDYIN